MTDRLPLVGKCTVEITAVAKPDPFQLAREIRRGERDSEIPDYDVITGWIQRVPVTWLPGLLVQVVTCCVVRKVFQAGKLLPFVQKCESEAGNPASVLRTEPESS